MYKDCRSNRIDNLLVLSNRAYANVSTNTFRELENEFQGTIIYWEVKEVKEWQAQ